LALAVIGLLFEMQQADRQRELEQQQAALEDRRAKAEREVAVQRAQDEALQAYLSQMSSLLLERGLRVADKDSEVSTLARARTVTVLQRLDADRNQTVIRFLTEARLTGSAIGLLVEADLQGSDLEGSDLNNADLSGAVLSGAVLRRAVLSGADLRETYLNGIDLHGADLSGTNLRDARGITDEQLEEQALTLQGATMPDGSIHP
jgi:uncharacterized protein YjbI with pentapeptide repeats